MPRVLLIGALMLALATMALLAAVWATPAHTEPPASGSRATDLTILGSADDNDLAITFDGVGQYVVTDAAGIVGCSQIDPQTVSCSGRQPSPPITVSGEKGDDRAFFARTIIGSSIRALGGEGRDSLAIEAGGSARARFSGDAGNDVLSGASARDYMAGGRGRDKLTGRSGDDRLLGGPGVDTLSGGPGDDEVNARTNDRDKEIRCGAGDDVAIIDAKEDPRPIGCETVKR